MKLSFLIGLCLSLILLACSSAPTKKQPIQPTEDVQKEFDRIQTHIAAGGAPATVPRLRRLIAQHPDTTTAQDATLVLAQIYWDAKNYQSAYDLYISLINSPNVSAKEGEALLGASKSLAMLGRYDEALALTDRSIRINDLSERLRVENYRLRLNLLGELGDRVDTLRAALYLAEKDPDAAGREAARVRAQDLLESRLGEKELNLVVQDSNFGWARGPALFRLGIIAYDNRDFGQARSYLQKVIDLNASPDLVEQARGRISQIDARRQVEPFTVGAVLPLSGKYANIGARTLRGLELGLGLYGNDRSDFRLAVMDEEGSADSARRGVERLVTENHVIAVVGSLLSRTAVPVASKADELGVPSIGLSQKAGLTEVGPMVFRNAMTSQMQVQGLVRIAMEQLGLRKFAILYPNDAYGVEYANLMWDEVLTRGGQITAVQVYEPNETDFSPHVERLVGKFYLEDREEEYKHQLKEWVKKQKSLSARKSIPENLLTPVVQFQALFVPDSVKALGQIAPMLAYQDVKDVRLLGTNLWNSEALITRGERHVEKAVFVDAMLNQDEVFRNSRFFKEYRAVFGEDPGVFESQGYDTGLLLRQLIASGERSRVGLAEKLSRLKEFPGSNGTLVMNPQREIYRPMVALTVDKAKIVRFR